MFAKLYILSEIYIQPTLYRSFIIPITKHIYKLSELCAKFRIFMVYMLSYFLINFKFLTLFSANCTIILLVNCQTSMKQLIFLTISSHVLIFLLPHIDKSLILKDFNYCLIKNRLNKFYEKRKTNGKRFIRK